MATVEMTIELARAAATDAGRRHAIKDGRPPAPWTSDDFHAAATEFNRICRQFKLNPWVLPANEPIEED